MTQASILEEQGLRARGGQDDTARDRRTRCLPHGETQSSLQLVLSLAGDGGGASRPWGTAERGVNLVLYRGSGRDPVAMGFCPEGAVADAIFCPMLKAIAVDRVSRPDVRLMQFVSAQAAWAVDSMRPPTGEMFVRIDIERISISERDGILLRGRVEPGRPLTVFEGGDSCGDSDFAADGEIRAAFVAVKDLDSARRVRGSMLTMAEDFTSWTLLACLDEPAR